MSKTFEFHYSADVNELVLRAAKLAKDNGMDFSGDSKNGVIKGLGIEGRYEIQDKKIIITIDKKPALAPWSMIQHRLSTLIYNV